MAITTYGELKTAVANWLNRSDLTSYVADLIRLGEQRIYFGAEGQFPSQPLRIPALEAQETGSLTGGASLAFPTRFVEPIRFQASTGSTYWNLDYVTPAQYTEKKNNTGYPGFYTYINNAIYVDGSSAISYALDYYQSLALLSSDTDTNWILTNAPGVYLYAALVEAGPFLREDPRVQLWHTMYRAAVSGVNRSANRQGGGLTVRAS